MLPPPNGYIRKMKEAKQQPLQMNNMAFREYILNIETAEINPGLEYCRMITTSREVLSRKQNRTRYQERTVGTVINTIISLYWRVKNPMCDFLWNEESC
jgi:hypothetical protein